jgi:SLT domain-containing protein
MFKQLAIDIAAAAIKAAIFQAIMAALDASTGGGATAAKTGGSILKSIFGFADGGIVTKPTLGLIGEAGQNEAIIPLSKLNTFMKTSFNAGSMSSSAGSSGGQFVLRGQDLLLATNRAQKASNLKGQSISLA